MNLRERFLEVMTFNTSVRSLKWEFDYRGEVMDRWYDDGLPKHSYPTISSQISTPTSDLYTPAWNSVDKARLPKGSRSWRAGCTGRPRVSRSIMTCAATSDS
jgi:hypothetical protein